MKKQHLSLVLTCIALASCGGGIMTPVSEKINGPLGGYFEVVNREYKAIDGIINIEIKRVKEGFPEPWSPQMEVGYTAGYFEPLFSVECLDKGGNTLSKDEADIVWDKDELINIASLSVGESSTIAFGAEKNTVKLKVGSTFTVHEGSPETTVAAVTSDNDDDDDWDDDDDDDDWDDEDDDDWDDDDDDDDDSGSSKKASSTDWNKLLNSYESFVDEYLNCLKKAADGDALSMTKYISLMEKADDFLSISDAYSNDFLNAAQTARYMKITKKLEQAAKYLEKLDKLGE